MRERRERVNGPYRRGNRFRVIVDGSSGERDTRSFATEGEAEAFKAAALRAIAGRTIAVAVEAYIAGQERRVKERELRESTVERERYHLRSMLQVKQHGQVDLRKLTPRLAVQLYDTRVGAVDTHRNGLSVCKAFGGWLVKQGWLPVNPFAGIKGRGRRRKGKPQLRTDEARLFMDVCLELAPRDDGAVLALMYLLLGTRAGESVHRQVRDVDDGARLLWIPDSKTEAGRRQLEVPEVLRPHLQRLTERRLPGAPLFEHAARRARATDWAREQVVRLCKLAGVDRVTPHGLRGTQATLSDAAGASGELVAAQLGHASTAITTGGAYIDRQQAAAARRKRAWALLDGGAA